MSDGYTAKQVIVIRKDLNMRKGKLAAQACHASLGAALIAINTADYKNWSATGGAKIVVGCDNEQQLQELHAAAKAAKLPCKYVVDAGLTEFDGPTATAVAIGPAESTKIDKITGSLKLL